MTWRLWLRILVECGGMGPTGRFFDFVDNDRIRGLNVQTSDIGTRRNACVAAVTMRRTSQRTNRVTEKISFTPGRRDVEMSERVGNKSVSWVMSEA